MRIVRCSTQPCWTALGQVGKGSSVSFRRSFNDESCDSDVFIVNNVCSSYWPDRVGACKTAVTNLRTGKISYVDGDREVTKVHAQVHVE
jgi:hypothetical protein